MHYRIYKSALQDCQMILRKLEKAALDKIKRLWIRGVLEDLKYRLSKNKSENATDSATLITTLEKIHRDLDKSTSSALTRDIQCFIHLLESKVKVKIRIDMLFARPVSATYFLQVYNQLQLYDFVDVRIVAADFYPTNIYQSNGQYEQLINQLKSAGVPYIPYKEYDVFHDLPDLFFYSFHNHAFIKPLHLQHSTLTPIINRTMFLEYSFTPTDLLIYDSNYSITPYTWLQFRSSRFSYNTISWGEQDVVTGHPLMDLSYNVYSGETSLSIPDQWKTMASGKKTVLWNLAPVLNPDTSINPVVTKAKILDTLTLASEVCERNRSILILLRPHPLCLMPEYQDCYAGLHEQVILDQNPDSYPSLSFADAFIGDYGSLYSQFLPSERPALIFHVPPRECNFVFWSQTNITSNQNDVFLFAEKLVNDYSSVMRPVTEIDQYCLGPMDGKNSRRITDAMLYKLYMEEQSFILKHCRDIADGVTEMEPLP